eukprot:1138570-Pelagomonas_calceolata.AAC.2
MCGTPVKRLKESQQARLKYLTQMNSQEIVGKVKDKRGRMMEQMEHDRKEEAAGSVRLAASGSDL